MGTYTEDELKPIHRLSIPNHDLLSKSGECACFSCLKRLRFDEIVEWLDDEPSKTAICPICSIDSIVPGDTVDDELLKALHKHYLYLFCFQIKHHKASRYGTVASAFQLHSPQHPETVISSSMEAMT